MKKLSNIIPLSFCLHCNAADSVKSYDVFNAIHKGDNVSCMYCKKEISVFDYINSTCIKGFSFSFGCADLLGISGRIIPIRIKANQGIVIDLVEYEIPQDSIIHLINITGGNGDVFPVRIADNHEISRSPLKNSFFLYGRPSGNPVTGLVDECNIAVFFSPSADVPLWHLILLEANHHFVMGNYLDMSMRLGVALEIMCRRFATIFAQNHKTKDVKLSTENIIEYIIPLAINYDKFFIDEKVFEGVKKSWKNRNEIMHTYKLKENYEKKHAARDLTAVVILSAIFRTYKNFWQFS